MLENVAKLNTFKKALKTCIEKLKNVDESLYEEIAEYELNAIVSEVDSKIEDAKASSRDDSF